MTFLIRRPRGTGGTTISQEARVPDVESDEAVRILSEDGRIPPRYHDHPLKGDLEGFRECHIAGDWIRVHDSWR